MGAHVLKDLRNMQVKIQRIIGDDRLQRAECIIENWLKKGFNLLWFQDQPDGSGEQSAGATIMIFKKEGE